MKMAKPSSDRMSEMAKDRKWVKQDRDAPVKREEKSVNEREKYASGK